MPLRQAVIVSLLSLGVAVWVLELVRRRRLKEEYALLWLVGCAVGLAVSFWYDGLVRLSGLLGIAIPTSTVFFLSLLVLGLISLHFAVRISELTEKVQRLAQELALRDLETQVPKAEGRKAKAEGGRLRIKGAPRPSALGPRPRSGMRHS
jgi:hypothetical protein